MPRNLLWTSHSNSLSWCSSITNSGLTSLPVSAKRSYWYLMICTNVCLCHVKNLHVREKRILLGVITNERQGRDGRAGILRLRKLWKAVGHLLDSSGAPYSVFLVPPRSLLRHHLFWQRDETAEGTARGIQQQDGVTLQVKRTARSSRSEAFLESRSGPAAWE